MAVISKYTKRGYVLLIGNLVLLFLCFDLFYLFIGSLTGKGFIHTSFMISLSLFFLSILMGWLAIISFQQSEKKVIDGNELKSYIPYFPIIVFYKDINDYDAKVWVKVYSRYGKEGIWLIKNGKVKYVIYDEAFSNFKELGEAINLPEHIIKEPIPPFYSLAYHFGLKRVNINS